MTMTAPMTMTAIIADDEPPARARLLDLLKHVPWLVPIGEAASGTEAVRLVNELRPDMLFLDLQMPGLAGLEVLGALTTRPAVIITTAYDRYAVAAFEFEAVDYLLKPFSVERFKKAVERACIQLTRRDEPSDIDRVRRALTSDEYLRRILVRERQRIVVVPISDVEWLEARDDYVAVFAAQRRHLIHVTLSEVESRLDPARFVRVHRSHIVNMEFVLELASSERGRVEVVMRSGARISVSRAHAKSLRDISW